MKRRILTNALVTYHSLQNKHQCFMLIVINTNYFSKNLKLAKGYFISEEVKRTRLDLIQS